MTTRTKKMTRLKLSRWAYNCGNREVQFIGNVIDCHMGNKKLKLMGLYNLAQQDRVGGGNTIDQVSIDGRIVSIGELEQYA